MAQRRVLVTGAGGQLGRDLVVALEGGVPPGGQAGSPATGRLGGRPPLDVVAATRADLDVTDRLAVLGAVGAVRPDVVFHLGAWTAVDACEDEPDRAFAVNALGTRHVADACRRHRAHLVYVSTDYVFSGEQAEPYREWDATAPRSVYGRSKLGGERELDASATIVRTSWVSGVHGANIVRTVLERARATDDGLRFVDDQRGSPTFTADLAGALLVLADAELPGTFHVTNGGVTTWYEFARAVLEVAGEDAGRVNPIPTAELDPARRAPRPANSALDNAAWRACGLPPLAAWRDALERMVVALASDAAGAASGL